MPDRDARAPSAIKAEIPHAARIWNYWMGGRDNYVSDRAAGDAVAAVYPEIVTMARESRRFLVRAVGFLARECGVRQFIDIGTGLPTMQNTHEVAQGIASESRVVYVDNDPLVLVHARALLGSTTPEGTTTYVHADYHDPDRIVAEARKVVDFREPAAVMFMGVLGYEPDMAVVRAIVGRVMDATSPGSHLVMWDGTDTGAEVVEGAERLAESGGVPYVLRAPGQLARCFEGLELVEPGLVPISGWRPADGDVPPVDAYGAVGRKP
ncbi:SAM-dependent methyltransferase [Actinomadura soli]|uniref:SAM-dependent methyltransferase n=1 Tax=Actinomadura soli TaxID=2508997 RepID=A0A5C4J927_9ACTN|nr:SAM-dependent methyltransferase [Actinomadura soli]TMQ96850.1 SAM-dependent methyltransferase [Actinomadura soli]